MTGYWILPFENNGVCPGTVHESRNAEFKAFLGSFLVA